MNEIISGLRGLVDQLNPLSKPNLILYFTWLFVYFFTATGIWRSNRRITRLCCFTVNQVFSIGLLISALQIAVPAIVLWRESLGAIVLTLIVAWFCFRKRKTPREEAVPAVEARQPALVPGGARGHEDLDAEDVRRLSDQWINKKLPPAPRRDA